MERQNKQIKLFEKDILLFERDAQDVFSLVDFLDKQPKPETDKIALQLHMLIMGSVISASLKHNYTNSILYKIFKHTPKEYTIDYLLQHLTVNELNEYAKLVYDLEGGNKKKRRTDGKQGSPVTNDVSIPLIMNKFYMTWDDVLRLPITKFRNLLHQAINIMSGEAGGEFQFVDKDELIEQEHEAFMETLNKQGK